jgi:hypothetical protein
LTVCIKLDEVSRRGFGGVVMAVARVVEEGDPFLPAARFDKASVVLAREVESVEGEVGLCAAESPDD